jgi:hypothetical protein
MKTLILTILFIGFSAYADSGSKSPSTVEAAIQLDCDDSVPGSICPARYSTACKTLLCDSQVKEVSPLSAGSEGTK